MPSDSQFAVALENQKQAERAEQQRIKNLVLNYDLQDTDQAGIEHNLYFDYFSQPNPNLRPRNLGPPLVPLKENGFAHNDTVEGTGGEKHAISHHQPNAPLQQSSAANAKAVDKSSSNRSGHRARKLQLSDVDWYDRNQKSSLSWGRGRDGPSRGSPRGSCRAPG